MKHMKRLFAVLVAVVMLVSAVPVGNVGMTASAAGGVETRIINLCKKLGISNPNLSSTAEQRGIYFTTDQKAATSDSDPRSNNYSVAQAQWFINLFGSGIGSSAMTEGWTCNGFAKFAYWYIFSGNPSSSVNGTWSADLYSNSSNASKCKMGDRLYFGNGAHQAIFLGYTDSGFIVLDSNYVVHPSNIVAIHLLKYSAYSTFEYYRASNYDEVNDSSAPTSAPEAPANFRCEKDEYTTTETVHFTWDAASGATEYWMYLWRNGNQIYMDCIGNSTSNEFSSLAEGEYTAYLRAGNSAGYSDSVGFQFTVYGTPSNTSKIWSDKTSYTSSESITVHWESVASATEYWIYWWKDGTQLYQINKGTATEHTSAPTGAGKYTCYMRAGNSSGYSETVGCSFTVYGEPPANPVIPDSEKSNNKFQVNSSVKTTWSKTNATNYWVYIWRDGTQIGMQETGGAQSFTYKPTKNGKYTIYVRAENPCGYSDTDGRTFYVGTYTLNYSANGGSGAPVSQTKYHGLNLTLQTSTPTRQGYLFKSWNTAVDGGGTNYAPGAAFKENQNTTLYAVWQACTHTWNSGAVTKAATCSATGVKTYTCSVCNGTKTENININPDNHVNTTNVAATASTCTVKGYTAGVYCNDCKQYVGGHAEQPLAAHTITVINKRDATYDAEGYTGDEYCTVCKQTIKTGTAIPKLTRPTDPQPSNPQPSGDCRWCGQTHGGAFGWLTRIIHNILAAIFGARY